MKKVFVLFGTLVVVIGLYAKSPFGIELDGRYTITTETGQPDYFSLETSVLMHIYKNFYARTGFLNVSFFSGNTYINFGTGVPLGSFLTPRPGFDILMFFEAPKTIPFALSGFSLSTGGGIRAINFRLGGGAEFIIKEEMAMRPFVEVLIDILNTSNASSHTENVITLKSGTRIK
ncbi:MAG: hypothetical protein ABIK61_02855 [candidate division WOR-3 bacterium]